MNLLGCGGLASSSEHGVWFRAIDLRHLVTPLAVMHSKSIASRFSPGYWLKPAAQFALLYLTEDTQTALYEIGSMLGSPFVPGRAASNQKITPVILNVHVDLQNVADLCDPAAQATLATSVQELTGDWNGYQIRRAGVTSVSGPSGIAPTQELGHELFRHKFEGFRTVSAKVSTTRNLIVFPKNLRKGSKIEFRNPDPSIPPYVITR